jgi:hypothetical protein
VVSATGPYGRILGFLDQHIRAPPSIIIRCRALCTWNECICGFGMIKSIGIDCFHKENRFVFVMEFRRVSCDVGTVFLNVKTKTPWPESASELYQPSDRSLLSKLVPTFADRGCHVVSAADRYGRILGFLNRSRYFFFQVAPKLYSGG